MCRPCSPFSTLETFLAYSQVHLKEKFELPPPQRPGPPLPVPALGVRFLTAPLDGGAARPGGAAPRWRGLAQRCRRHALQILRDFSGALVLLAAFCKLNEIWAAVVRPGLPNCTHSFGRASRGRRAGGAASREQSEAGRGSPRPTRAQRVVPSGHCPARPRGPGPACEMAARVVAFCFCALR